MTCNSLKNIEKKVFGLKCNLQPSLDVYHCICHFVYRRPFFFFGPVCKDVRPGNWVSFILNVLQIWITLKLSKLWRSRNFVTFPKTYLGTFKNRRQAYVNIEVSMASEFWQERMRLENINFQYNWPSFTLGFDSPVFCNLHFVNKKGSRSPTPPLSQEGKTKLIIKWTKIIIKNKTKQKAKSCLNKDNSFHWRINHWSILKKITIIINYLFQRWQKAWCIIFSVRCRSFPLLLP